MPPNKEPCLPNLSRHVLEISLFWIFDFNLSSAHPKFWFVTYWPSDLLIWLAGIARLINWSDDKAWPNWRFELGFLGVASHHFLIFGFDFSQAILFFSDGGKGSSKNLSYKDQQVAPALRSHPKNGQVGMFKEELGVVRGMWQDAHKKSSRVIIDYSDFGASVFAGFISMAN